MLTKTDLLLLLTEIDDSGINAKPYITAVIHSDKISLDVLKFIDENRHFDVSEFYKLLRKNYNHKKSSLYKNLVREEFSDPSDILTTLSAFVLQVNLFAKNLENNQMFLKHSRVDEVTKVLNTYYTTYDLIPCMKALKVIKTDLKAFELFNK